MVKKFYCIAVQLIAVINFSCIAQGVEVMPGFKISGTVPADQFKVSSLNSIAFEYLNNNPDQAFQMASEALKIAAQINFDRGIADAYLCISMFMANQGKYEEALRNGRAAIAIYNKNVISESFADQLRRLKQMAQAYQNIGTVLCHQSSYPESLKNHDEGLKIRYGMADMKGVGDSYNAIGMVYRWKGEVIEAMKYYLKALKIQEEIADHRGMAHSFQNIGIIDIIQGNYSEAMKNLVKAYELLKALNDKRGSADALGNMGWCFGEQGQYEQSLQNTIQAVKIFSEIGDKKNMSIYYNNIGFLYKLQGNYTEAMKNLLMAAQLSNEIGDKANLAETYESIGEAHYAMKNSNAALLWLNKAYDTAEQIQSKRVIKQCYLALARVYIEMDNYRMAYKYRTLYGDMKELIDEENSRKIAEMKSNFESEKKNSEIQLLNKDKELLKQAEKLQKAEIDRHAVTRNAMFGGFILTIMVVFLIVSSIYKSKRAKLDRQISEVEMKVLRSQMNPHFIFNSLYSIDDYIKHNKTGLASEYLIKFSKLMRTILENSRHKDVVLVKELEVLKLYMLLEAQRMEFPFTGSIVIDPEIDPEIVLIPPMLLQPVVENSIWHGLAPKEAPGTIFIRLSRRNETIHCEVEDNGIGRKQSKSSGKIKTAESYGLKILAERLAIIEQVKQVKTSLYFDDLYDNDNSTGLRVSFSIPYEESV